MLVGLETKGRKHVDWETYSSMFDGTVNKKSGIFVILLPSDHYSYHTATHVNEKQIIYPECTSWMSIDSRAVYEERYPFMPDRIIDNLLCNDAKISVVPWHKIGNDREKLRFLIDATFNDRASCKYDLSRPLRRQNS